MSRRVFSERLWARRSFVSADGWPLTDARARLTVLVPDKIEVKITRALDRDDFYDFSTMVTFWAGRIRSPWHPCGLFVTDGVEFGWSLCRWDDMKDYTRKRAREIAMGRLDGAIPRFPVPRRIESALREWVEDSLFILHHTKRDGHTEGSR